MPLRYSIPLPGPFRYTGTVGGHRRRRPVKPRGKWAWGGLTWGLWLLKWAAIGLWQGAVWTVALCAALIAMVRQQRSAVPPHREH